MMQYVRRRAGENSRLLRLSVAGLGLALIAVSPVHAQDIVPPKAYTTTPTGVNLADGSFTYSVEDLQIGPLKLERYQIGSYLTDPNTMFFGAHTSHNFDIYVSRRLVKLNEWRAIVHLGTGSSGTFFESATSISNGNRDSEGTTLTKVGGQYVYTDASGTVYTFTSSVPAAGALYTGSQRVSTIAFPDGRVQTFSYDGSGKLKLVSDSSGYAILFDYSASGMVSAACGFNLARNYVTASSSCSGAALVTQYSYTSGSLGSGYTGSLLTGATDVLGNTTSYGWGAAGITCVTPPGYATCKVANTYSAGSPSQVTQQTLADGAVWHYSADLAAGMIVDETGSYPDGSNYASYTDPAGKSLSATFTKSTPYSMTDANGNTSQFRFMGAKEYLDTNPMNSEGTLLTEATSAEGNKYIATYDGSNRLTKQAMQAKPGSGLPDLEVKFGYGGTTPQNVAKPIWKQDAKGNQTDFTYASWGGVLSEMQPAPSAGAARPLKLATYVQKYAYVKNAGGALVVSGGLIWLPATETLCQTAAGSSTTTCDTAAPITVTSYEYGADGTVDNLLLRGVVVTSGSANLRTCYGYDEYGNKIFETKPRAGLSSCS